MGNHSRLLPPFHYNFDSAQALNVDFFLTDRRFLLALKRELSME